VEVETYDPIPEAHEMLGDVLRTTADEAGLLALVGRWGVPRVGTDRTDEAEQLALAPQARATFDTLWAVRRLVQEVQRHFR
jgi:hypothetical protein